MEIETTVGNGFPVLAVVTVLDPPEPDVGIRGWQIEFELRLGSGKPAPAFVYNLMTDKDHDRILDEIAANL